MAWVAITYLDWVSFSLEGCARELRLSGIISVASVSSWVSLTLHILVDCCLGRVSSVFEDLLVISLDLSNFRAEVSGFLADLLDLTGDSPRLDDRRVNWFGSSGVSGFMVLDFNVPATFLDDSFGISGAEDTVDCGPLWSLDFSVCERDNLKKNAKI